MYEILLQAEPIQIYLYIIILFLWCLVTNSGYIAIIIEIYRESH